MALVVTELVRTSLASPSQWEGKTKDGRAIYIRYRSGWLEVGVGDNVDQAADASAAVDDSVPLYREKIGGNLDGEIAEDELLDRLRDVLSYRP
jgi:hypothetical protein